MKPSEKALDLSIEEDLKKNVPLEDLSLLLGGQKK
jgi:hypothetical protein